MGFEVVEQGWGERVGKKVVGELIPPRLSRCNDVPTCCPHTPDYLSNPGEHPGRVRERSGGRGG